MYVVPGARSSSGGTDSFPIRRETAAAAAIIAESCRRGGGL